MTLVLDAGGLGAVALDRARLAELRRRGMWPAQVSAAVLAESLTGDHRRDFHVNRLLRICQVRAVDERQARDAARLRTATGRAGTISAVDAIVIALACGYAGPVVLTTDPADLRALADHASTRVSIVST